MAETKLIPTLTTSLSNQTDLEICSEYLGVLVNCGTGTISTQLPNIRIASFFDYDGNLNGISFNEGELVISGINIPIDNDIWINNQGELIVKGVDSDAYYIDNDGNLIYDYCWLDCQSGYYVCDYIANGFVSP